MKIIKTLILSILLTCCYTNIYATILDGANDSITNDIVNKNNYLLSDIDSTSQDLSQAVDSLQSGDLLTAKKLVAKILSKTPGNAPALHISGIIFLKEKRYDNAQVAFEAALRSDIKNPALFAKLGVTRLLQGNSQKGKRLLNHALTLEPNNQLALSYLAWIAETEGQYSLATSYLQRLMKIHKSKQLNELHVSTARLLSKSNEHTEVIKLISPFINNKSQADNPLIKQATVFLIESYIQTSNYAKAKSLLKKSSANKTISEAQSAIFNIELLIKQKKYKDAQAYADKAANKLPAQAHVIHYATAQAFAQVEELNKAIDEMSLVVSTLDSADDKNKLFSALNDLTALYVKAARKIDALQVMQKYADKYPESPLMTYQLAELQASVGQYDQANKNLDKIIRLSPNSINAYYLKGIIARRQKQHMNAEKWFSKVNRMEPKNEQAWVQRSGSFADAGNMQQAITILSSAVKKNETSPALWFEYGALLTDAGRHEEAAKAYKTVLIYYPDHLPSIDNLAGSLLILENNAPEALLYAERAYKMDPSDTVLQLNYLEALLLNEQYKSVLNEAKTLQASLKPFARFHYYLGASQLHTGNKKSGIKELKLASNDRSLDKRYKLKIDMLLNSN